MLAHLSQMLHEKIFLRNLRAIPESQVMMPEGISVCSSASRPAPQGKPSNSGLQRNLNKTVTLDFSSSHPKVLGGGVLHGSQNPDLISDQNI